MGRDRDERLAALTGSIAVRPGLAAPQEVVLVDDVLTTAPPGSPVPRRCERRGRSPCPPSPTRALPVAERGRRAEPARAIHRTAHYHLPGNARGEECGMRIDVKGRNVTVEDELRRRAERRFEKVARQVSSLARLELELYEERNPSIRASQVAEATLQLKGVTLRARDASEDLGRSINLVADELARQVKRHRDKRRGRRAGAAESRPTPI
jgi:putative sigma-54 modulation protein